jgi:hypothetical protein
MKRSERSALESECIDVDMGSWSSASGRTVLRTVGLGPCIGVATFDPATGRGHLGHFMSGDGPRFEEFMESVTAVRNMRRVRAWARGGQIVPGIPEMKGYALESRRNVERALASSGIRRMNTDVAWTRNPDESTHMLLNCATGDFRTVVEDIFGSGYDAAAAEIDSVLTWLP